MTNDNRFHTIVFLLQKIQEDQRSNISHYRHTLHQIPLEQHYLHNMDRFFDNQNYKICPIARHTNYHQLKSVHIFQLFQLKQDCSEYLDFQEVFYNHLAYHKDAIRQYHQHTNRRECLD